MATLPKRLSRTISISVHGSLDGTQSDALTSFEGKVHNSAITEKESGMPFLDLHPEQFLGSNSPISFAETAFRYQLTFKEQFHVLQQQKRHYFYQCAGGYFESTRWRLFNKISLSLPAGSLKPWEFNWRAHGLL